MDFTHGFMEVPFAQALGFDYEEYREGDTLAAVVEMKKFEEFQNTLHELHRQKRDKDDVSPHVVRSNIHGICLMLTKYCSDEFMDDLTDGPTKEQSLYLNIRRLGDTSSRFDYDRIVSDLKEIHLNQRNPNGATTTPAPETSLESRLGLNEPREIQAEQAVGSENKSNKKVDPIKAEEKEIIQSLIKYIQIATGYIFKEFKKFKNGRAIYWYPRTSSFPIDNVEILATGLNKNIFIVSGPVDMKKLRKSVDKTKLSKHIIILIIDAGSYPNDFARLSEKTRNLCLGHRVSKSYYPLTPAASKVSAYSKYGSIFKDTATNVLFALRDSYELYLMIPWNSLSTSTALFKNMYKEIVRRWDGDISIDKLKAIDAEYYSQVVQNNKQDYIKFCLQNTNDYIRNTKKALKDAIDDIQKLQRQLFEKLKMYRQYADIVDNFDEGKHEHEVTKQAMGNFDAITSLPQVSSIFVEDGMVHVYTTDINVKDDRKDGKLHNIGTFHIQLGMNRSTYDPHKSVIITNTKHRIEGYSGVMEAPHVFNGGALCHGNLVNSMVEHYKNRDLYNMVMGLIMFLESVNTGDPAGKYINKFPVAEVKKEEKPKPEEDKREKEFDDQLSTALSAPVVVRREGGTN